VNESSTHTTPKLALSLAAPNRLAARTASIASFVALAVAGYLRFDIGHPGAGRLLAVCWAATIFALIVLFSRTAQEHYRTQFWDLPLDLGRIRQHQKAKAARAAALTPLQYRREVARAICGLAVPISQQIYVVIIMLPTSAIGSTSSGRARWLVWSAVAFVTACSITLVYARRWWAQPRTDLVPPA
jgi:hypothetical protein